MPDIPFSALPMLVGMGKEPGERVQFNLNFVHIPYNNEVAGTGILTIMV